MAVIRPLRRSAPSVGGSGSSKRGFFSEYTDSVFAHLVLLFGILMLILAPGGIVWHLTNTPSSSTPHQVAQLYFYLLLPAMVWLSIDMADERNKMFSAVGLGGLQNTLVGIAAGALAFLLLDIGAGLSFYESFLATETLQLFFFIVIVASFVEEIVFRGTFFPLLTRIFESGTRDNNIAGLISLIIVSTAFGLFHWQAYGANIGNMVVAVFFGVVFTMGNYVFRTLAFSITWHILHNGWGFYLAFGPPRIPTFFIVIAIFLFISVFLLGLAKLIFGYKRTTRRVMRG